MLIIKLTFPRKQSHRKNDRRKKGGNLGKLHSDEETRMP